MIDFQSGYILRPVNPVFIYFSLLCALLLSLLPIGNYSWVPDWLIICIVFWNIHQHRYIGVGTAFFLGLLMDVHTLICWACMLLATHWSPTLRSLGIDESLF
jgi:rod shape-determining protein MreD